MLDDEKRKYYEKRFEESQKSAQVDPWAKAIKDGFTKEFNPIVISPEQSANFEAKEN